MNKKKRKKPCSNEKKAREKQLSLLSFLKSNQVEISNQEKSRNNLPSTNNDTANHNRECLLVPIRKTEVESNIPRLTSCYQQLCNKGHSELLKQLEIISDNDRNKEFIAKDFSIPKKLKSSTSPNITSWGKENDLIKNVYVSKSEQSDQIRNDEIQTYKYSTFSDLRKNVNVRSPIKSVYGGKVEAKDFVDIENLDDFFNDDWIELSQKKTISLDRGACCVIMNTDQTYRGVLLALMELGKDRDNLLTASCLVIGYWCDIPLKCKDVINIKAYYDSSQNLWCVDDTKGYIVKNPDILISGTHLVGSLFCQRRAVLSHIFPGMESMNSSMLIGSLIHELLQEVLIKKIFEEDKIKDLISNLVNKPKTLFTSYECGISLLVLRNDLEKIIPEIVNFVNLYILDKSGDKTWPGKISKILSTEENFWIPSLGIKGKTDFIVQTVENGKSRIMPLELKTGRATNSVEHRGQIVLYLMMMSEVGLDTNSGLLLYLKHNSMEEIKPNIAERRGLISTRNNLVDYYSINEHFDPSDGNLFVPILPEPINHRSGCSMCPYLTMCSAFLKEEKNVKLSDTNLLKTLSIKCVAHLSPQHFQYVFFWISLLKLEEIERKKGSVVRVSDIWRMSPEDRQMRGYCLNNLAIAEIQKYGNKFLHYMKYVTHQPRSLTTSGLAEHDYIVISSLSRIAIAMGYVHAISESVICLKIDRELDASSNSIYIIDKYSVSEALLAFNTSNLFALLENNDSAARLRRLIIDKETPLFSSTPHIRSLDSDSCLSELNVNQKEAVLRALAVNDYLLIKGLPGTGKTATITALIKLLVRMKYSILVTSHTHSAVDNILLRLKGSVQFLRLGSNGRVHADLKTFCEEYVIEQCDIESIEQLDEFYNHQSVIAVTCMGCSHHLLNKRVFDYCIVDEATQVLQPSILKCLYSSRKFILVGDPNQLPPIVQSRDASRLGFDESLFKKLERPEVTSLLWLQYRMNSEIMKLANLFAYDNLLQCDSESVQSATIMVKQPAQVLEKHKWMRVVLSSHIRDSVVFLNTARLPVSEPFSEYSNQTEADITFLIVKSLIQDVRGIGIIAPYREQVNLLRKIAKYNEFDIEINTVDQYQGRDKDVIIYSCTMHNKKESGGILCDKRRLTVAITRARKKLIIVGNVPVLKTIPVFEKLICKISEDTMIDLTYL